METVDTCRGAESCPEMSTTIAWLAADCRLLLPAIQLVGIGDVEWVASQLAAALWRASGSGLGGGLALEAFDHSRGLMLPADKAEFFVQFGQVVAVAVTLRKFDAAWPGAYCTGVAECFVVRDASKGSFEPKHPGHVIGGLIVSG